jgi:hypothetical protein
MPPIKPIGDFEAQRKGCSNCQKPGEKIMTWWPGWDSVVSAGYWSHFWFWFGIVCLFALGASEVASHMYGLRKDELVAIAESAAATQRQNDADAAEARRKVDVEGVQKQLAEANKKVADLDRLRQPRHLTEDQKGKLTKFITENSKGSAIFTIKANAAESDARAYADEIAALFNSPPINWQVKVDNAMIMGADTSGFWITIKDANAVPPATGLLQAAFVDAGFPIKKEVQVDPGVERSDEIWLTVGTKK